MRKREANKLTMFESVISYMDANTEKCASILIIGETVTQLKADVV